MTDARKGVARCNGQVNELGVLTTGSLAIHGVHIDEPEIDLWQNVAQCRS